MSCASETAAQVQEALHSLSKDVIELDIGGAVPVIHHPVQTLDFYRSYVARNRPVVIQGAMADWPAMQKWQATQYLASKLQGRQITVAMTPNGRADAVAQLEDGANCFALPHEEQMGFEAFLALLSDKQAERVVYAQAQNDSLRQEFAQLMPDIDPELAWAAEIFGQPPDAVNLWIGDSRSVTTFHRDFYENMYGMVAGSKTFTLLPPCDSYRLHKQHVPVARYRLDEMQGWSLQLQQAAEQISWCPIDRDTVKTGSATAAAQQHRFPDFFNEGLPPPLEVILHPGDMLYLPCMWHHMVEQDEDLSGQVIAVNFWFNQHFGTHYAANVFAEKVGRTVAV